MIGRELCLLNYLMRYCDEIDSWLCTRLIVSAKRRATERIVAFLQFLLNGIEFVNIISVNAQLSTRSDAGSDMIA